ncbi:MAG: hypothetical protein HXX81_05640 [Campylobacterales bacterium]|nr:hypothetical protein [Campylobacterales bacterium]
MHVIRLKVEDNIYQNIMFLLSNLNVKGLQIDEITTSKQQKSEIKKLFQNKKIELFKNINNPVDWQRKQRDEWE